MRLIRLIPAAGVLTSILCSCGEKSYKNISEGEIYYTIEYVQNNGKMSAEFKPKTLVISFKNDKILFEILTPFGNQGIVNVVNPEKGIYDTYVNILGTRLHYSGSANELLPGFGSMKGVKIRKTHKTANICGFNCKHAEAIFPIDSQKVYDIWYTTEIKVKNSNVATPFNEIDGVLMSFYYILGGSVIKFEAESVFKKEIPEKLFEERTRYKPVAKSDMDKIITDMINL